MSIDSGKIPILTEEDRRRRVAALVEHVSQRESCSLCRRRIDGPGHVRAFWPSPSFIRRIGYS
jgi:hypothetical protein